MSKKNSALKGHRITANGAVIYEGEQFGSGKDDEFDELMLAPDFETAEYIIPKSVIHNGCVDLEFFEPVMGVMFCEFWITHD